ncbi:hypothetical protein G9A89_005692 [Geosiphon pyriformis]|nr:hypothetical protein G9A89_005692 [Geosiphon pyriformis]
MTNFSTIKFFASLIFAVILFSNGLLVNAGINVNSPQEGAVWLVGSYQTITWVGEVIRSKSDISGNNATSNTTLANLILPPTVHEIDRLQQLHYTWRWVWMTNFSAPVQNLLINSRNNVKVLDIGCGPGTWILEMAAEYQNVQFWGIDIFASFPSEIKPPNVHFLKGDALNGLPFENENFDFVVMRNFASSLTLTDWSGKIFDELVRVVKPGGFIESQECIWNVENMGPSFQTFANAWESILQGKNIDTRVALQIPGFLKNTPGISYVTSAKKSHSLSKEGGKLAESFHDIASSGLQILKPYLQPVLRINSKTYDNLIISIRQEFEQNQHSDVTLYRTWGQKAPLFI